MAYWKDDIKAVGSNLDEVTVRNRRILFVDQSGSPVGRTEESGDIVLPKSLWEECDSSYLDNHVVRTVNGSPGAIVIRSADDDIEVDESESTKTIYIFTTEDSESSSSCPKDPAGGAGVPADEGGVWW